MPRVGLRPFRRCAALHVLFTVLLLALAAGRTMQGQSEEPPLLPQHPLRVARTAHYLNGRRVASTSAVTPVAAAQALAQARAQHLSMLALPLASPLTSKLAAPRTANLGTPWTPVGPAQILSASFGALTGRVTALVLDPADKTGNTLYVGTTGGGVWKSSNAAGPAAAVQFVPLTDTLPVYNANAAASVIPSLSIGALAMAGGVLLAGTGDPNDATDSYYGAGVLRSSDGGATWTLATGSHDGAGGNHSFFGLSFAAIAFSSVDPTLVVAAVTQSAEGTVVSAPDPAATERGLYYSNDAGLSWHLATVTEAAGVVQSPLQPGAGSRASAVVWNPRRQRFYAALERHGFYESADGVNWTRLAQQPGAGLAAAICPVNQGAGSPSCLLSRAALAVEPASGDMYALTVDAANRDQGLYRDACGMTAAGACAGAAPVFATRLDSAALDVGNGSTVIAQADYNLTLAAAASGADTLLYVGTIDLFRCSLADGCKLRNTTNAANGCLNPAGVFAGQHALAALPLVGGPLLFAGNDGGLYRSTDGVKEQGAACSLDDANHFENLNGGLGSLAEVVSFAEDPSQPGTLLAGLGALGTAGTGTASTAAWPQLATGEGGTVAIDPQNPGTWYLSTNAGVSLGRCAKGAACVASDFSAVTIGPGAVANDEAAVHAPWLLDPADDAGLLVGTCRVWRGPAASGALWSGSNAISRPFGAAAATGCSATFPVVRSLAAGGQAAASTNVQSRGSEVLYAGLAGTLDGGQGLGGHLFVSTAANLADRTTVWTDAAKSRVTNDFADAFLFNPAGFDISSIAVDPHDATGRTVYATVMGFASAVQNAPHVYRSVDAGASWTNISANLPNAPANGIVVDPNDANTLYVALDTGVYVTTQVSNCTVLNCWSVYGAALPNAPVVGIAASSTLPTGDGRTGELRAATYGRGIWEIPLLTASSPAMAAIALNPAQLDFGIAQVGTSTSAQTITVTNTGNASLAVSRIQTSGDFQATDHCSGAAIVQGATCTIELRFVPSTSGVRSGQLIVYGNVAGGQAIAALTGVGTPPAAIVLTPASLVFAPATVGAVSAAQNITLANTGGNAATVQSVVISGDFEVAANTCGAALGSQASCTLSIAFAPVAAGVRTGTVTVTDDAGVQVASLSGTGTAPATDALAPGSLSFSPQPLNTSSASQVVTLTNAGDNALTLIAAQVSAGDFTVVNGCGNSLAAHASCSLSVGFVPKSVGAQSGVLTVADQFRTQTITLGGTGVAPPGVSLSPVNGLGFGVVGVGLSAMAQTLTLTNNGGLPLQIANIAVTGDYALLPGLNTCGASLAPAAVCTVAVTFSPSATGLRGGSLTVADNAVNSPQMVALTGTGADFALAASGPASMTIASGQAATYALLLSSAAGVPGNAVFTCSGLPAHSTCTVNPTAPALGGTTSVTVTVATGLAMVRNSAPFGQDLQVAPWDRRVAYAGLLPGMLASGMLLCGRRRRGRRRLGRAGFLLLLGLFAVAGCGVSRTVPGGTQGVSSTPVVTPSGSSTILVAASSAGLVRSVSLTLIVQ